MNKSLGSRLASLRWKKEKPDKEYFSKIGKLGAKKRWENKQKKYGADQDNFTKKYFGETYEV